MPNGTGLAQALHEILARETAGFSHAEVERGDRIGRLVLFAGDGPAFSLAAIKYRCIIKL
jgi:hypothetical protein